MDDLDGVNLAGTGNQNIFIIVLYTMLDLIVLLRKKLNFAFLNIPSKIGVCNGKCTFFASLIFLTQYHHIISYSKSTSYVEGWWVLNWPILKWKNTKMLFRPRSDSGVHSSTVRWFQTGIEKLIIIFLQKECYKRVRMQYLTLKTFLFLRIEAPSTFALTLNCLIIDAVKALKYQNNNAIMLM